MNDAMRHTRLSQKRMRKTLLSQALRQKHKINRHLQADHSSVGTVLACQDSATDQLEHPNAWGTGKNDLALRGRI